MKQLLLILVGIVCSLGTWAAVGDKGSETLAFSSSSNNITITKAGTSDTGGDMAVSKGVVTVTSSLGYYVSGSSLNVYKKGNFTVGVSSSYKITKVEFTYASGCYPFSEAYPTDGGATTKTSKDSKTATYTPTTDVTSINFTNAASGKTAVNSIVVSYEQTSADVAVTGVSLDKTTASIKVGETANLTATVTPTDATNKSVTWSTSDKNIAKVANGVVTGVGAGTATITATTADGGKTASCEVTVTSVPVTGVSLNLSKFTMEEDSQAQFCAYVEPEDASNQNVTYSSSDETVATVDATGHVLALKPGTTDITVTTEDGGFTYKMTLTVTAAVETDELNITFSGTGTSSDSSTKYSTDAALSNTFASGYKYVKEISELSNIYPARIIPDATGLRYTNGAKFGTSSSEGSITIELKEAVKASKIVVTAAPYGDSEGQEGFTLNGVTVPMTNAKNKVYEDYEVALYGTEVSKITLASVSKRLYIESITIVKGDNSPLATVSVSDAGYATYYNSRSAYVMPEGMTGKTATVTNGVLTLTDSYAAGTTVPADEALVLSATKGDYDLVLATSVASSTISNDLLGTDAEMALDADDNSYFYALSYDKNGANVGFYWMEEGGSAFINGAHKAYLKVAKSTAGAKSAFAFDDEGTTAINAVEVVDAENGTAYNLVGQRVDANAKGFVIKNGRKFINK